MHKRWFVIVTLSLLIALLVAGPTLAQEDKTLYAKSYDVDITVLPNGDMQVIERQTIVFTSGTFSGGDAYIPTDRTEGITNVQVIGDGTPYQQGNGVNEFTVETDSNQIVINWNFRTTSNSTHVYELHYTVKGGLRYYSDYGELWWKAIPPDHAYSINSSTIQVHLPAGATILKNEQTGADYAGTSPDITKVTTAPNRLEATFTSTRSIAENQEVEVRVRYQPGVIAGQAPTWQAAFDRQQSYNETTRPTVNLLLGLLGAAILLGGPLLVLGIWYTLGRDPSVGLMADQVSSLPANTPPGVVGTLVDEKADLQDILATMIDLARRGYMTITEEKGTGVLSSRDFVYRLTDKPANDLLPFEQLLLKEIFGGLTERRLSSLKDKFYTSLPKLQNALYAELVKEGFFSNSPQAVRQQYGCLGAVLIALAIGGTIAASSILSNYADTFYCPFIGLGITAIVFIVVGQYMPHKTRQGAEAAGIWRAFKNYLAQIEKYNLPEARDRFDEYLPYAVAFGLERSVIRKFASVQAPVPTWYMPYPYYPHVPYGTPAGIPGGKPGQAMPASFGKEGMPSVQQMSDSMAGSLQGMSDGLISMFNSASKTFTSQPSSSKGGHGWSGGGGFHGGGGGGGGGRGFH